MDKKRCGPYAAAMTPKQIEGSRLRPLARNYNVMIPLVHPSFFGTLTYSVPQTKKVINMKTSLPFGSENL